MSFSLLLAAIVALPLPTQSGAGDLYRNGDGRRPAGTVGWDGQGTLHARLGNSEESADARIAALEQLAYRARPPLRLDRVQAVRRLVRGEAQADYIRCLGMCLDDREEALEELERFRKRKTGVIRAEYVYAYGRLSGEGEAWARARLADRREDPLGQVAALRLLADLDSPFAMVEALRRTRTAEGPLLLEALATIRREPSSDAIPYLVDLLAAHDGRPQHEAVQLLRAITGYRIGPDYRTWKHFQLKHRAEGTPFRLETDDEDGAELDTLAYLGVPLWSDAVVFVLDSSGSMNQILPEQRAHTRGTLVVEEFTGLLPRLPGTAKFNVVFFDGGARAFAPRLVAQGDEAVDEASAWVRANAFEGSTNIFEGLSLAFADRKVEEIVLLSDGSPTAGEIEAPARILARVARWNRWRRVRVSTISFGAPPSARAFLFELSRDNDGDCRVIQ